jgi:DNA repair protein RadC
MGILVPERIYHQGTRIADLEVPARPRERLVSLGVLALTNAEILALLVHAGLPGENAVQVGQRLLNTFGGLWGLHSASFDELVSQHGIGVAKAASIKAGIDLGRRLTLEAPRDRTTINSPADAAALVQYEMVRHEAKSTTVLH